MENRDIVSERRGDSKEQIISERYGDSKEQIVSKGHSDSGGVSGLDNTFLYDMESAAVFQTANFYLAPEDFFFLRCVTDFGVSPDEEKLPFSPLSRQERMQALCKRKRIKFFVSSDFYRKNQREKKGRGRGACFSAAASKSFRKLALFLCDGKTAGKTASLCLSTRDFRGRSPGVFRAEFRKTECRERCPSGFRKWS